VPPAVEEREVFRGDHIRVVVERWQDPDREREIVRHPGAVAVVALTGTRNAILVRQLREAVGERLLELPAGVLDVAGEAAETAARRELEEETGHRAASWSRLGRILASPGFSDEAVELFLATGAEPVGPGEEGVEVVRLPLDEARAAIEDGRIVDAKTIVGLLLASP
jgi:8-oxo-dGTP pyrophosphatase MutT (NUDIX family)